MGPNDWATQRNKETKKLISQAKDTWYANRTVYFSLQMICITLESIALLITALASFLLLCQ